LDVYGAVLCILYLFFGSYFLAKQWLLHYFTAQEINGPDLSKRDKDVLFERHHLSLTNAT